MSLTSGEGEPEESDFQQAEENKARAYDFRTANRFPKEQIRTLNIVFQNFAQLFASLMTGMLRTACECELLSVEEISFNEFNNSLPSPVFLAVMEMVPLHGSVLLQFSPESVYTIISRLFGGASGSEDINKPFTEIDIALMERMLRQLTNIIDDAWHKVIEVRSRIERVETSSQFVQIVPLNEPVALITLNVTIGDKSGLISICIPHTAIESVAKQLSTRTWYTAQDVRRFEGQAESIERKLNRTSVTLTAYFDETTATVQDILSLRVGDVIRLKHDISQPIKLRVQHIPKFDATIGTSGGRYAVKLLNLIEEEEDDESIPGRD